MYNTYNDITDVEGVTVGQVTIKDGEHASLLTDENGFEYIELRFEISL